MHKILVDPARFATYIFQYITSLDESLSTQTIQY